MNGKEGKIWRRYSKNERKGTRNEVVREGRCKSEGKGRHTEAGGAKPPLFSLSFLKGALEMVADVSRVLLPSASQWSIRGAWARQITARISQLHGSQERRGKAKEETKGGKRC